MGTPDYTRENLLGKKSDSDLSKFNGMLFLNNEYIGTNGKLNENEKSLIKNIEKLRDENVNLKKAFNICLLLLVLSIFFAVIPLVMFLIINPICYL